jgi:alpha-glucosidase
MTAWAEDWWHRAVLYQIYVRSFADSNGDGVGDLQGVIDRLDHLQWLGIGGIWLSPVNPSPNRDWGYDVSDYRSIHPELGDMDAFDRLVREADRRGVKVLIDLVPNHTSDQHPWFVEARSSRESPRRDWYVWADPRPDRDPPNNWRSSFRGPAWTFDDHTSQWYLHNFLAEQPDLNWWNDDVRDEFEGILRFWFERGVAGFRIDVAHALVKDRELRDNPPADSTDHPMVQVQGLRPVYNANRPEVHEVYRRWRQIANAAGPGRVLVGETYLFDLARLAAFYGHGDELHLGFNFPFAFSPFDAGELSAVVQGTEGALPADAWPVWFGSNHDLGRFPTRWCQDDGRKIRCALFLILCLRGTAFLYYGDEIGMPGVLSMAPEQRRDPVGRDWCRTPMQWQSEPGAGFTDPGVEPWLPIGDADRCNVADQRDDPGSVLHLARDLIRLRSSTELGITPYRPVSVERGLWIWERGSRLTAAANLSDEEADLPITDHDVLIGTNRDRDGERIDSAIRLNPWEAALLARR